MARILVVDDEKSIRITLRAFLRDAGYEVGVAEDAEVALGMLAAQDFDVVLSDIIMPQITGMDLLQSITETAPQVQVILMTGEPTVEPASEAVRADAFDYLFKPIAMEQVLRTVANAVKVKTLDDERRRLVEENRQYRENLEQLVEERTAALRESEERFRILVEHAVDGFFLFDMKGRFLDVNTAACTSLGYTRQELLRMSVPDVEIDFTTDKLAELLGTLKEGEAKTLDGRHQRKDGSLFPVEVRLCSFETERKPLVLALARDITERKQAEEALRESEARNRALLSAIPDMMFTFGEDGTYLSFMPAPGVEPYVKPEDFLGKNVDVVLPADKAQRTMQDIRRALETGAVQRHEYTLASGQEQRDFEYRMVPSGDGEVLTIVRDITERKQAEESLRQSEERFKALFQGIPVATYVFQRKDDDFVLADYNISGEIATQGKIKALIGALMSEIYDDEPDLQADVERCYAERTVVKREMLYRFRTTGDVRDVVMTFAYVPPHLVMVHCEDITERKQAQEALRQSEEKFSKTFHATPDALTIETLDQKHFIEVNDGFEHLFGYRRSEAIGRTAMELNIWANPDDHARMVALLEAGGQVRNLEFDYCTKSGEVRQGQFSAEFLTVEDVPCMLALSKDITERKQTEENLRTTQEYLDTILLNLPVGMAILEGPDFRYYRINHRLAEINGLPIEDHLDRPLAEVLPDAAPDLIPRLRHVLETGEARLNHEFSTRVPKDPAVVRHFIDSFFPIKGADGKPRAVGALVLDITERKQAEEILKESEQRFRELFENSPDAIFVEDFDGIVLDANPAAYRLHRAEHDLLVGRNVRSLMPPDQREVLMTIFANMVEGVLDRVEGAVWTDDGEGIPVEISVSHITYEQQRALLLHVRDITDRKRIEQELIEKVLLLDEAQRISKLGVWKWDIEADAVTWSEELYRIYGLDHASFRASFEGYLELVHPEDRDAVKKTIEGALATGNPVQFEERIVRPDGEIRHLRSWGNFVQNAQGTLAQMFGVCMDVTEQKQAENQLKASLREKEVLLKEIHHRVKNNLQIISSLLNLQASQIDDEHTRSLFRESQQRIRSMAFIHEKLYQTKDIAQIDLGDYIRSLARSLLRSYSLSAGQVRLDFEMDECKAHIDTALPCGLIVNELVSNALKYAFTDQREGILRIALKRCGPESYRLEISDNGGGFPKGLDYRATDSLGLQLVMTFVEQLEGTIEMEQGEGTRFLITFDELKYKERLSADA